MSYRFFENTDCAYYPCHDIKSCNCLFCYCPLYNHDCAGVYSLHGGVKDCTRCSFPHTREAYDKVIDFLSLHPTYLGKDEVKDEVPDEIPETVQV